MTRRVLESGNSSLWESYASDMVTDEDILDSHATGLINFVSGVDLTEIGDVDSWLRGRFSQFANRFIGHRGIWVRPCHRSLYR